MIMKARDQGFEMPGKRCAAGGVLSEAPECKFLGQHPPDANKAARPVTEVYPDRESSCNKRQDRWRPAGVGDASGVNGSVGQSEPGPGAVISRAATRLEAPHDEESAGGLPPSASRDALKVPNRRPRSAPIASIANRRSRGAGGTVQA